MKKLINYIKKNTILFIFILLFIINSILVKSNIILPLDNLIHSHLLSIRNNELTSILKIITNISSAYSLIALSIILLLSIKNKRIPIIMTINLTFSAILNNVIKHLFLRTRPVGINLIIETGFSYPSGHSMVSMSYFGFLIYLIYKSNKKKLTKIILISITSLIILLVGFSRIYLGVHYFSDVIGGYLLSCIYLNIYLKLINSNKFNKK